MKTSILIPVRNEAANLPALFRALAAVRKKSPHVEIIFIDNASTDGSRALLAGFPGARVADENAVGFAQPLNRGLAEAHGENILFLDADALPEPGWVAEMEKALAAADVVVGETDSLLPKKATAYGRAATAIFRGHSRRAAHAEGHALPWGPTCNLAVKRRVFDSVDGFSPQAAGAMDIDWCWRAVLAGFAIAFAPKAKVKHLRRNDRESLLKQFDRYGLAEAWLHRTYSFLVEGEGTSDPLLTGAAAFARLRAVAAREKNKALAEAILECAAAFASGVRFGYERFHAVCELKRGLPRTAVAWESGVDETTVFVPHQGVTQFSGKLRKAWVALREGASDETLAGIFTKFLRVPAKHALHEAQEFRKALTP